MKTSDLLQIRISVWTAIAVLNDVIYESRPRPTNPMQFHQTIHLTLIDLADYEHY